MSLKYFFLLLADIMIASFVATLVLLLAPILAGFVLLGLVVTGWAAVALAVFKELRS